MITSPLINRFANGAFQSTTCLAHGSSNLQTILHSQIAILSILAYTFPAGDAVAEITGLSGNVATYGGVLAIGDDHDEGYSFSNGGIFGAEGRLRLVLSSSYTGQADVNFEHVTTGTNIAEYDEPYGVANVALHFSKIEPNRLVGGFVSFGFNGGW